MDAVATLVVDTPVAHGEASRAKGAALHDVVVALHVAAVLHVAAAHLPQVVLAALEHMAMEVDVALSADCPNNYCNTSSDQLHRPRPAQQFGDRQYSIVGGRRIQSSSPRNTMSDCPDPDGHTD